MDFSPFPKIAGINFCILKEFATFAVPKKLTNAKDEDKLRSQEAV